MVLGRAFSAVVRSIEGGFYRWGRIVGQRPWIGILLGLVLVLALGPVRIHNWVYIDLLCVLFRMLNLSGKVR